MKKTFTFLAIATILNTASFAQKDHQPGYNYGKGRDHEITINNNRERQVYGRDWGTYYFSAKEKDMQLFSINGEYNRRIESVKHKLFMGRSKKQQIIYSLELQRNAEINSVIAKFNDRKNLFDGRDKRGWDRDRKNNW